jgi:hypothetical protein
MIDFVIFTRWLLERMHFQPFPSARNICESEGKGKVENEEVIHYYATTCTITRCMAIIKTKCHQYFSFAHPLCAARLKMNQKIKKQKKP